MLILFWASTIAVCWLLIAGASISGKDGLLDGKDFAIIEDFVDTVRSATDRPIKAVVDVTISDAVQLEAVLFVESIIRPAHCCDFAARLLQLV